MRKIDARYEIESQNHMHACPICGKDYQCNWDDCKNKNISIKDINKMCQYCFLETTYDPDFVKGE